MSAADAGTCAHVDGYRLGARGAPCTFPPGLRRELEEPFARGWRIGRSRHSAEADASKV